MDGDEASPTKGLRTREASMASPGDHSNADDTTTSAREASRKRILERMASKQPPSEVAKAQSIKAKPTKLTRTDTRYKEIRDELARKHRKKKDMDIVQEYYVDSNRMLAVQIGSAQNDLKDIILESGMRLDGAEVRPGDPTHRTYIKLANYHIGKAHLEAGLFYATIALRHNPDSLEALYTVARVQMLLGKWDDAKRHAELVLASSTGHIRAMLVKAESLYNLCQFEHALVVFHRGHVLAPDNERFRLGIQKCRKTLQDSVKDPNVFQVEGIASLFSILRRATEIRSCQFSKYSYEKKDTKVSPSSSLSALFNLATLQVAVEQGPKVKSAVLPGGDKSAALISKKRSEQPCKEPPKKAADEAKGQGQQGDGKQRSNQGNKGQRVRLERILGDQRTSENLRRRPERDLATRTKQKSRTRSSPSRPRKRSGLRSGQKQRSENLWMKERSIASVNDRLLDDKVYLTVLAHGINSSTTGSSGRRHYRQGAGEDQGEGQHDDVENKISGEARKALDYLMDRQEFWDQLEVGRGSASTLGNFGGKACESFRSLM